jgi:hypothetical protein
LSSIACLFALLAAFFAGLKNAYFGRSRVLCTRSATLTRPHVPTLL